MVKTNECVMKVLHILHFLFCSLMISYVKFTCFIHLVFYISLSVFCQDYKGNIHISPRDFLLFKD